MIRCIAIDDEPLALQQLASYIKKIPYFELVAECQNAIEAKEIIENDFIGAIFIDINMPDINGLDFVKSLVSPPIVVFTTAYAEYAVDSYKVNAVDYLLKPIVFEDFQRASEKVKRLYDMRNSTSVTHETQDDTLFIRSNHRTIRISISDIRYIEGMSEYIKIYLEEQRPMTVLFSMKKIEEWLPQSTFMRIHRSYIVNLKKIQEVNKNRVIMDSNTYLPIGDLYKDALTQYISARYLGK